MILLVESAEYMGKHTLLCTFNNGERRKVDLTPLLKYPAFEELKDESKFERYGVDVIVFWANGADITPEYLYENGTPFRNTCCCSRRLIKKAPFVLYPGLHCLNKRPRLTAVHYL